VTDEPPTPGRRKVRRGEGEVTEWPRGLVDYTPTGAPETNPSPEEDRDQNRLRIAARLLGFARAQGRDVDAAVRRLWEADRAFRAGDRATGRRLVDEVTSEVEALFDGDTSPPKPST
jgi:hypothetical protein